MKNGSIIDIQSCLTELVFGSMSVWLPGFDIARCTVGVA